MEAGQTAGYGGYQLVGQSVDPPQAAKIPNPKPVQGEVGLACQHVSYSCHTAVIHPVGTKFSTLFFFFAQMHVRSIVVSLGRPNSTAKYPSRTGTTGVYRY